MLIVLSKLPMSYATTNLIALVMVCSCSVQPSSNQAKRASADTSLSEVLSADAMLFERLTSMLPLLDYSKQYFLGPHKDSGFDGTTLSDTAGSVWQVSFTDISEATRTAFEGAVRVEQRLVMAPRRHLWVFSGNRISRSAHPDNGGLMLDSAVDDEVQVRVGQDFRGWSVRAHSDELNDQGQLDVLYVDDELAITRSADELIAYLVSDRSIKRRVIIPPVSKSWDETKAVAVGRGSQQKGLWVLAEDVLFFSRDLLQPVWSKYQFSLGIEESPRIIAAQIPITISADSDELQLDGAIVVLTETGFFGYAPNGELRSSRRYDPDKVYDWSLVKPLAQDYCVSCHAGYLGYEEKEDWLRAKDFLKTALHPDNLNHAISMPPAGSLERERMTSDERSIFLTWLKAEGAKLVLRGESGDETGELGPRIFRLGADLEQAIAAGTAANCLNCHSSGADNMHLASWWVNPVRNGRTGLNGLEASIATMQGQAPRMPPAGGLGDAQRERIIELMLQLEFE